MDRTHATVSRERLKKNRPGYAYCIYIKLMYISIPIETGLGPPMFGEEAEGDGLCRRNWLGGGALAV